MPPGKPLVRRTIRRRRPLLVDDGYCHSHSTHLRTALEASEKQSSDKAFLGEFINYVRRENPPVLPMIEALSATGNLGDTAELLGTTESEFGRTRNRLSQLAKCFLSGEPVPKQRRPYKKQRESRACELVG